jgi:nucleoside-diphosphate-sugar epimerase
MAQGRILITGASGNLGSRLARHMADQRIPLRLMVHRAPVPEDIRARPGIEVVPADLGRAETLPPAVRDIAAIVHFAGVLFAPRPDRFLPVTNTQYFAKLVEAAVAASVERIVLISFPQVEGPTGPEHPATGRLDRAPISVHARTRLEEERLLFARTDDTDTVPVVLRLGMVYGAGILMIEAGRWLARHRLLAVWRKPTVYQLISTEDFLRGTTAAATKPGVRGVYHGGDERPVTIQDFLDAACEVWGHPLPWRVPEWTIDLSAACCELFASVFGTKAPFTRDFVRLGRVPHWGDTGRFRRELLPTLVHPTFDVGRQTLR